MGEIQSKTGSWITFNNFNTVMASSFSETSSGGIHEEVGTDVLRQRRGSLQGLHPQMMKQTEDSVGHRDGTEALKCKNPDQLPQSTYIKPVAVIVMAFMVALIGSVVRGPYRTVGAGVRIVNGFVGLGI